MLFQTHLFLPFLSLLTWFEHPGFYILSCDWVCLPSPISFQQSSDGDLKYHLFWEASPGHTTGGGVFEWVLCLLLYESP